MKFIAFVLAGWVFVCPLFGSVDKTTPEDTFSLERNLQYLLIDSIKKMSPGGSLEKHIQTLHHIYRIYRNSRDPVIERITPPFFKSIAISQPHRQLRTYVYYYISRLHQKKIRERYLVKSLGYSLTTTDRQFALYNLYQYYKKEKLFFLAQTYLGKLIEIQEAEEDNRGLEGSYSQLGEIYEQKRNFPEALNNYFHALNYSHDEYKSRKGRIYFSISRIFRSLNRKQLAEKYLSEAMDFASKHHDHPLHIEVLNAYSSLYYQEGDYENALKYISFSLNIENKLDHHVCAIDSLHRKALILTKMTESENRQLPSTEVMDLLKKAVDKGLELEEYENLLPVMTTYIQHLIAMGELADAAVYMDNIEDIYAPYYPRFFYYHYLEAILFEKMGRMEAALTAYNKTVRQMENYLTQLSDQPHDIFDQQVRTIFSRIIRFYIQMYNRTRKEIYLHKAVFYGEVKNAYVQEGKILKNKKYRHLSGERKKLEADIARCSKQFFQLLKSNDPQDRSQLKEYENRLENLKKQNEDLMEFMLEIPYSYKRYDFKELNIQRIRLQLKPNQLILKYVLLDNHVYVFYIERGAVGYSKLDIEARELVELVRQLTEPLDDFTRGNVDYLRINYDLQSAHRLYNILLRGVLESRPGIRQLFIIPDRELFRIPFEALVTRFRMDTGMDAGIVFSEYASVDYLIEHYTVTYYLSLFHIRKKSLSSKRKFDFTVTAYGNPVINRNGEDGLSGFRDIPSSGRELSRIAEIYRNGACRVFPRDSFITENFEAYAPRSRIVHIATHFINNLEHPRYSALLFSASGSQPVDYYHAHDVLKLKLGAELVVLSACESSEKNLLGVQGLRGMTASFRSAGVGGMIVSMWPVDEYSSRLVPCFYRHYKNGMSEAAALRAAKLEIMKRVESFRNGQKISFAHPFLWADYILYRFSR